VIAQISWHYYYYHHHQQQQHQQQHGTARGQAEMDEMTVKGRKCSAKRQ